MPTASVANKDRQTSLAQFQGQAKALFVRWAIKSPELKEIIEPIKEKLDPYEISARCRLFARFLEQKEEKYSKILMKYETLHVAKDETRRCLDLFNNIHENNQYFVESVGGVTVFLPRNQPLYAFSCFAVVPSLMAREVHVRPPVAMKCFFQELMECLEIKKWFPNINISYEDREVFVKDRIRVEKNPISGEKKPVTDVVIFTGTMENADEMRRRFSTETLFIANGAGHNPIVIGPDADIAAAVKSALRVQLYNQGQDCANPNTILVHEKVHCDFLTVLKKELGKMPIGSYSDPQTIVGPLTEAKDLKRIQNLFVDNFEYLDPSTPGVIKTKEKVVEPTIIIKSLSEGANYIEQFAPVFFVQKYERDEQLSEYFEDPKYEKNAMYITLFGTSRYVENLINKVFPSGRVLHDQRTIIRNTDLHAEGVERGTEPYGGYGRGASCVSLHGVIDCKPTCPQRDIYEYLVKPNETSVSHPTDKKPVRVMQKGNYKIISSSDENWTNFIAKNFANLEGSFQIDVGIDEVHRMTLLRSIVSADTCKGILNRQDDNIRCIVHWHDFDEIFIGNSYVPFSAVKDPLGEDKNIFERRKSEIESLLNDQGIIFQSTTSSEMLTSENVKQLIGLINIHAEDLDQILEMHNKKTDLFKIRSRFSGTQNTEILSIDDEKVTYHCLDTSQRDTVSYEEVHMFCFSGEIEMIVSWMMNKPIAIFSNIKSKWSACFACASDIATHIFKIQPPTLVNVGQSQIQGTFEYISGPQLGRLFEEGFFAWLFVHQPLDKKITISLNSSVFGLYDTFDAQNKRGPLSLSQAILLGQCANWEFNKVKEFLTELHVKVSSSSLKRRLATAHSWLKICPELQINLLHEPNLAYLETLKLEDIENISTLCSLLSENPTLERLETALYEIPKSPGISTSELKIRQKMFFSHLYNLILGRPKGPRLSTLLKLNKPKRILRLLEVK